MLLLHLHLLSIVCLEMMTFHKDASLVFNLLFTIVGEKFMWTFHKDVSLAFNLLFTILGEKFMWTFHKGACHQIFLNIWHSPIEAPLWPPQLQNRNNVLPNVNNGLPFQFMYMRVEQQNRIG
jgi:hypothetical protein